MYFCRHKGFEQAAYCGHEDCMKWYKAHGAPTTTEEVYESLGDPSTWEEHLQKVKADFERKPLGGDALTVEVLKINLEEKEEELNELRTVLEQIRLQNYLLACKLNSAFEAGYPVSCMVGDPPHSWKDCPVKIAAFSDKYYGLNVCRYRDV